MLDGSLNIAALRVTTHIGRALLASADQFRNEAQATNEYVLNAAQYVDAGVDPVVQVSVRTDGITISDNGRGMDFDGLANFFTLHGENLDRKHGQVGRGRFGTGKSAAFAIANTMRLTTVRNGKLCSVQLRRADILAMKSGDAIPVEVLKRDGASDLPNGTTIEIRDLRIKPNRQMILEHIRREISGLPNATVIVNGSPIRYTEPELLMVERYSPEPSTARVIGEVELVLKVAKRELPSELQGKVMIRCNGALVATYDGGQANKEFADRIFGFIDVPRLDDENAPVSAFDASRSLRLNEKNDVALRTHAFIAAKMDQLRRQVVDAERRRRAADSTSIMKAQVSIIEQLLNQDLRDHAYGTQNPVGKSTMPRSPAPLEPIAGAPDAQGEPGSTAADDGSGNVDGAIRQTTPDPVPPTKDPIDQDEEPTESQDKPDREPTMKEPEKDPETGQDQEQPATSRRAPRHPRSGVSIEFDHKGEDEPRASCARGTRIIVINLDHPQIAAACEYGQTSIEATRVFYDAIAHTYATLTAREMIETATFSDQHEVLTEMNIRLDRINRAMAGFYRQVG